MKTLQLTQGTPEWVHHRATHHNASEAPAMMGVSAKLTRSDLVRMKATGTEQQFSQWVEEVLFERGHDVEAAARPLAEDELEEELFPTVGESDDHPHLSASFDGIDMAETVVWECKQWNEAKAVYVRKGQVPPGDYWQCVQQLVVSRAKRLLYTLSDGTPERTIHCELESPPAQIEKGLLDGWRQFDEDVKAYKPDPAAAVVVGRAPDSLPALLVQVTGAVTQSNLPEFKERAIAVFKAIKTDLQTDEDFADAEQTVKFCKDVEDRLEAAKQHALSQTASIDELFRAIDDISAEARTKRLNLDKAVKARKDTIRMDIIRGGANALAEHCAALDARLRSRGGRISLPVLSGNFAAVIKGLKTIASLKDAVATELARMKIEANGLADKMDANLTILREKAGNFETLFPDVQSLALKATEDLLATIEARISNHHAEQRRREEAALRTAQPPAAVLPAPSSVTQMPAPKPRMRADGPTGAQIIEVLALHYRVHESKVIEWLLRVDLKAESDRMVGEEFSA